MHDLASIENQPVSVRSVMIILNNKTFLYTNEFFLSLIDRREKENFERCKINTIKLVFLEHVLLHVSIAMNQRRLEYRKEKAFTNDKLMIMC